MRRRRSTFRLDFDFPRRAVFVIQPFWISSSTDEVFGLRIPFDDLAVIVGEVDEVADGSGASADFDVANRRLASADAVDPVAEVIGAFVKERGIWREQFFGNLIAGAHVIFDWLAIE